MPNRMTVLPVPFRTDKLLALVIVKGPLSLIGVMQSFSNAAREMDIGGLDGDPAI